MATFADYTSSGGDATSPSVSAEPEAKGWSLERLKRSYMDYINSKTDEVNEQKDARRYRHASQWTNEQVKILNKRKQPIVTYNRIGRKIDGVIGLIEKLKQSPKAFPRTPREEGGAALATAVVRSVLDSNEWKTISYQVGQAAAIDGFAGIELTIEPGDQGDPTVTISQVENDGFFYDPRSIKLDFSDARFMGQGKWLDLDQAREMFPDKADDLEDAMESATDLSTNSDREQKWFIAEGNVKRIRIIDEWYILDGEWHWCIYTGNMKLKEGPSYLHDDKGKTVCRYIMFSAQVDQDGDRYGFVRNLKSAQDEINQRRSKALHLLNTRRIIAENGAFDDIEITRRESARPDGIVIRNKGFEAEFDDGAKNQEIQAHLEFLVDAKSEIENFGPNPALIGQGSLGDKSGRAISLLQQAGIAELGPFLLAYRGWKIRLYRGIWAAAREHWKAERYIRVTDDEKVLQWVGLNQVTVDPQTGMPAMENHIANLDVDIIMDEGPDSLTMGIETYEALLAIAQSGTQVPPGVLIELHPNLDPDTKKRILEQLQAPDPMKQLEQMQAQAEIEKMEADTQLSQAKAMDTMRGDQGGPQEHPMVTQANVENTQADTAHKKAQAMATMQDAMLKPREQQHQEQMDREQVRQGDQQNSMKAYDSQTKARQGDQANQIKVHDSQAKAEQGRAQTAIQAHDSATKARHGDEQNEIAREGHDVTRETAAMKSQEGSKPKKKKKSGGVSVNIDGTMASQINESAKSNTEAITNVATAMAQTMAQATQILAKAASSMADSSNMIAKSVDHMAKVTTAPKRVVRDAKGRVSHVETM
jgi:hypothetical protein